MSINKFSRYTGTPLTIISSLIVFGTGLFMYYVSKNKTLEEIHAQVGVVFFIASILHIIVNFVPFKNHLKKKNIYIMSLIPLIVTALILANPPKRKGPPRGRPGGPPSASSFNSQFLYQEFYPNSDKKLQIQSIKCNPERNELKVEKFIGEKLVSNGKINFMNLYIDSGNCKDSPISSVWQEEIEMPQNGLSTHVYITIRSENISIL